MSRRNSAIGKPVTINKLQHPSVALLSVAAAAFGVGFLAKQQIVGDLEVRVSSVERANSEMRVQFSNLIQENADLNAKASDLEEQIDKSSTELNSLIDGKQRWKVITCERLMLYDPSSQRIRADLRSDQKGYAGLILADDLGRERAQLGTRGSKADIDAVDLMLFDGRNGQARHHFYADSGGDAFQIMKNRHGTDVMVLKSPADAPVSLTAGDIHGSYGNVLKFGDIASGERHGLLLLNQRDRNGVVLGEKQDGSFGVEVIHDVQIHKSFPTQAGHEGGLVPVDDQSNGK